MHRAVSKSVLRCGDAKLTTSTVAVRTCRSQDDHSDVPRLLVRVPHSISPLRDDMIPATRERVMVEMYNILYKFMVLELVRQTLPLPPLLSQAQKALELILSISHLSARPFA